MNNDWIRSIKNANRRDYDYNLFCIPYAGGGTSVFRQWQTYLNDAGICVCPVLLPGRENRMNEALIDDAFELVEQIYEGIRSELNRPFLMFGHSMGGIIAYELSRLIYERENKLPEVLFLSGTSLPDKPNENPLYICDDSTFITHLIQIEGTDPDLASEELFRRFFLPIIRNDYKLAETYCFQGVQLPTRVCAFFSRDDNEVPYTDTLALSKVSENFDYVEFTGGHFFINNDQIGVCRSICSKVGR